MQINYIILKIGVLTEKIIFTLLRLAILLLVTPIFFATIMEKIQDNCYYPWGDKEYGWSYMNENYYKASINLNIIIFSIVLLFAIFSDKLPRYVFYIVVLLFLIVEYILIYYYTVDNPPTWILDIF